VTGLDPSPTSCKTFSGMCRTFCDPRCASRRRRFGRRNPWALSRLRWDRVLRHLKVTNDRHAVQSYQKYSASMARNHASGRGGHRRAGDSPRLCRPVFVRNGAQKGHRGVISTTQCRSGVGRASISSAPAVSRGRCWLSDSSPRPTRRTAVDLDSAVLRRRQPVRPPSEAHHPSHSR